MEPFALENSALRLGFDADTGALVDFTASEEASGTCSAAPRVVVPAPGSVAGTPQQQGARQRQRLGSVDVDAAARSAVFRWNTVLSELGGEHAISVTMHVHLDEHQARWETTLENRSQLVVENVYVPYFGDVAHPPGRGTFQALVWEYMRARVWPLWPTYQNTRGYYGVDHPIQLGPRYTAAVSAAVLVDE